MTQHKPIAELPNYIVLDQYTEIAERSPQPSGYQSEADLEKELIKDLSRQGITYVPGISSPVALLANARVQLQKLNKVQFTDKEWNRFVDNYLDPAGDTIMGQKTKCTIGRERMERERSGLQSGFEGDFVWRNGKNEKYNLDEFG